MKIIRRISTFLLFVQTFNSAWAGSPPNPTASDISQSTAGGTDTLLNNAGPINTGFGFNALFANFGGTENTAIGGFALFSNIGGNFNTASGSHALFSNSSGSFNTAIGTSALHFNTVGNFNTANGESALRSNTIGSNNTATGNDALIANTRGNGNTGNGAASLFANTTGNNNTATGAGSISANTNGNNNTASGAYSLEKNNIGSTNTALGFQALRNKVTGNGNLAVGANAGFNLTSGDNNIYIANAGIASESLTIRLGNAAHTRTFISGIRGKATGLSNAVPVIIDGNGQMGTLLSSARYKQDIHDMNESSKGLLKLRPVTFHYKGIKQDSVNPLEYGLIAEEVAKIYPDLVAYGADGKIETVQYQKLTPMLLNEVQRLNRIVESSRREEQNLASAFAAEKLKNQTQAQTIAELKAQLMDLKTQSVAMKTLAERVSRLEARQVVASNR